MENNNRDQKGTPSNPSQAEQPGNSPQEPGNQERQPQEGEERKVVASNEVEAFDDDFEVREEDKIGENEIKTLDENNTSGTKRGDTFNKDANG
jgi:hypothetical protein